MEAPTSGTIALVGAGPRGATILERIGANFGIMAPFSTPNSLTVHVIDDAPSGAGKIWRTDQTRALCMNTLADAVTLFTEPSSTVTGPVIEGPTLFEWCALALHAAHPSELQAEAHVQTVHGVSPARLSGFESHPVRAGFVADYFEELSALRPESHPSRALYGEYLAWFYDRAVAALPRAVRVVRHYARAVSVNQVGVNQVGIDQVGVERADTEPGTERRRERVTLSDGSSITADAVVVATGWLPRLPPPSEQRLTQALKLHASHPDRPTLTWVRPESPIEQDLSGVEPGAHAIVRGLGMGFFDTVTLLTAGRGGVFEEVPTAGEEPRPLRYTPSGNEPILHVTSRRGVPFRSKSLYGGLPPRAVARHLRGADWDALPRPIDFDAEVWPRIVADAHTDFYETLFRTRPEAFAPGIGPGQASDAISVALGELLQPEIRLSLSRAADSGDEQFSDGAGAAAWLAAVVTHIDRAVALFVPGPTDRFDLLSEMQPASQTFAGPDEFDAWVRAHVADDLAAAELGTESALKAGLWSLSAARAFVGRLGSFGAFDAESRASGFATLQAVGGMVGSGPPAFRNRQLLALIDAGLVRFIGPEALVEVGPEGFTARSPRVQGSRVTATVLIDAWMHSHNAAESADPLTASLISDGRARPFHAEARDGTPVATGGIDVEPATGRIIDSAGNASRSIHFAGIPVDETVHDTIISPMPGTDPTMLRETDRVARSALRAVTEGRAVDEHHAAAHHNAAPDTRQTLTPPSERIPQ